MTKAVSPANKSNENVNDPDLGRIMAVAGDEAATDDQDDLFDFGEQHEGQGEKGDAGNEEPVVKENATEAPKVTLKRSPLLPSSEEVDKHDATHYPYRSWCKICVAAMGREDPHRRRRDKRDEETDLPTVSMDYEMLEEKITTLVVKDNESGSTLCYDCVVKGPTDTWVVKQLVNDIEHWGRKDICLKSDGEPAMLALQRAVADMRTSRTVLRNPPVYNPQSNGAAEKAVQDVSGHMRVLVLALEARLKTKLDLTLPIIKWVIRHAAFLHSKYCVGHDGLTPYRRLMGRTWSGVAIEFGEKVLGKLALKKSSTQKKTKSGKRKLANRSVEGVYVGVYHRTGEHIIVKKDGEAIRVRTINRLVIEDRWKLEDVLAVRAVPRRPNPRTSRDGDDIDPKLNLDGTIKADAEKTENHPDDARQGGEELGRPEHAEAHTGPRELRIDGRLLEKFGFTDGCDGCLHKQLGLDSRRGHTDICRQRIYEAMRGDEAELDRLAANEKRLGREVHKHEKIRRSDETDAEAKTEPAAQAEENPAPEADPEQTHGG